MSKRPPRLVCHHSLVLKKASALSLALSSSRVIELRLGSKSCSPSRTTSQHSRNVALLVALALLLALALHLLCSLLSRSNHRLNCLKLVHHPLVSLSCGSVSMFTINIDNCPFLFLFLFLCQCLRVCIGSPCTYRSYSLSPDPS